MAISFLDAILIRAGKVKVRAFSKNSKHGFSISEYEGGNYRKMLVSEPKYDSRKEAREEGNEIVEEIKKGNLKRAYNLEHKHL